MTTLSWPNFCLLTDWEGESAEYEGSETEGTTDIVYNIFVIKNGQEIY